MRSRWMLPFFLALLWALAADSAWAAVPPGSLDTECRPAYLTGTRLQGSLTLHHRGHDYTWVTTTVTAAVRTTWPHSADLLLSPETEAYRRAMRCLLRGADASEQDRDTEWRHHPPRVVTKGSKIIEVTYDAETWISSDTQTDVGLWRLDSARHRWWSLDLVPPATLRRGVWTKVRVDLGGPHPLVVTPRPISAPDERVMSWSWKKPLAASTAAVPVHVEFRPPLAQGLVARSDDTWQTVTGLASGLWFLAVLVLVVVVVRPLRNRGTALPPLTSEQRRATSTLLSWTVLSTVVSLVIFWSDTAYRLGRVWFPSPDDGESLTGAALWHGQEARWDMLQAAVLGFALCLYGRPRRTVLLFTGLVTGAVCMVPISPGTFGLPSDLLPTPDDEAPAATVACFTAIDAGIVFVWLIGLVACGQHVVRMVRANGRDKRRV